jgi:hypothetical protein
MTISREEIQKLIAEGEELLRRGELPKITVTHLQDDGLDLYDVFTVVEATYVNVWAEDIPLELPPEQAKATLSILFALEPEQLEALHKQIGELLQHRND